MRGFLAGPACAPDHHRWSFIRVILAQNGLLSATGRDDGVVPFVVVNSRDTANGVPDHVPRQINACSPVQTAQSCDLRQMHPPGSIHQGLRDVIHLCLDESVIGIYIISIRYLMFCCVI